MKQCIPGLHIFLSSCFRDGSLSYFTEWVFKIYEVHPFNSDWLDEAEVDHFDGVFRLAQTRRISFVLLGTRHWQCFTAVICKFTPIDWHESLNNAGSKCGVWSVWTKNLVWKVKRLSIGDSFPPQVQSIEPVILSADIADIRYIVIEFQLMAGTVRRHAEQFQIPSLTLEETFLQKWLVPLRLVAVQGFKLLFEEWIANDFIVWSLPMANPEKKNNTPSLCNEPCPTRISMRLPHAELRKILYIIYKRVSQAYRFCIRLHVLFGSGVVRTG